MEFEDLLWACKAIALKDAFYPTAESLYKRFCRQYSERFRVALPEVYKMDPEHVITEVYAANLDDTNLEENIESLTDQIYSIEDPEYAKWKEEELQEFIEEATFEERERVKEGKPIHPALEKKKKRVFGNPQPKVENKPTRGAVDFGGLKDEES